MATGQGRVQCPQCAANNFDTVTVCWKCGASLTAAPSAPGKHAPGPQNAPTPVRAPGVVDRFVPSAVSAIAVAADSRAANRAAIWLGLLMPYFGLPIGLAFVMCDDRRRQEVGRICIIASVVSGVIHVLVSFVLMLGIREYLMMALNAAANAAKQSGGMGGPEPM